MESHFLFLALAGAIGALCKDIIQDGKIKLPKKIDGDLSVGFLGGMTTGAIAGYFIDGNPATAFLAGYAGTSVIENLLAGKKSLVTPERNVTEQLIRKVASKQNVNPDLAVKVAKCESNLEQNAVNINIDGSKDRGIFQINDKFHSYISDEEAFNPILATEFFCKAFKQGNLNWWNATEKCWGK